MTDRRPLSKIRMTPLRADSGAKPEPTEPGRHRRSTDGDIHIPRPRKPAENS